MHYGICKQDLTGGELHIHQHIINHSLRLFHVKASSFSEGDNMSRFFFRRLRSFSYKVFTKLDKTTLPEKAGIS
jgi:hypothetical protein